MRTLEGHWDLVDAVAVAPDGRRGVSGGRDKTLKVWDLASGECLATWYADAPTTCCAIASSGRIACGDVLGNVTFLNLIEPT